MGELGCRAAEHTFAGATEVLAHVHGEVAHAAPREVGAHVVGANRPAREREGEPVALGGPGHIARPSVSREHMGILPGHMEARAQALQRGDAWVLAELDVRHVCQSGAQGGGEAVEPHVARDCHGGTLNACLGLAGKHLGDVRGAHERHLAGGRL